MMTQMLTNQAVDATGAVVVEHGGGDVEVIVAGTFGGGTVTLMANFEQTGWVPVRGGAWIEPEVRVLSTARKCQLRLDVSGATTPSLNAWI